MSDLIRLAERRDDQAALDLLLTARARLNSRIQAIIDVMMSEQPAPAEHPAPVRFNEDGDVVLNVPEFFITEGSAPLHFNYSPVGISGPFPSTGSQEADGAGRVACTARPGRARRLMDRIADSWIGDLIGAACLFVTGYILIVLAGVLS